MYFKYQLFQRKAVNNMKKVLFLAAVLALFSIKAYSQTYGQGAFGDIGSGVTIPVGEITNGWGIGYNLNVNAGYVFHPIIAARVDIQYNSFSRKGDIETGFTGYGLKTTTFMADVMLGKFDKSDVKPYALVGAGIFISSLKDTDYQGEAYYENSNRTEFGMKLGAGVKIKVGSKVSLFTESSYNIIFAENTAIYVPVKIGAAIGF